MCGYDGFDIMARGEVGFNAGADGGRKSTRHRCYWLGESFKLSSRSGV